jgi:hypothetical protein
MKRWLLAVAFALAFTLTLAVAVNAQGIQDLVCTYEANPYRPGGICKESVPYVDANITDYEWTCSSAPDVNVGIETCGRPPTETCPNGQGECMNAEIFIDLSKAELGGLGPDERAVSLPQDFQAQYYPFVALGGLPLNLTVPQPKESFRTFWRLNTQYQQFNARAKFFQRFRDGRQYNLQGEPISQPIYNSEIPYFPIGGVIPDDDEEDETSEGEDKYGINVGYGHIQPSFCSLVQGKIAVILVGVNETNMGQYIDCYRSASKLIVRVEGIRPELTHNQLFSSGATIAQICQNVDNCLIEFSNEPNNKDTEYPCPGDATACGAQFASQFASFRSGVKSAANIPVGVGTLDIYNSVYPYEPFLAGAQSAYSSADVAFANVYCLDPLTCDVGADIATIRNFSGGKEPILTEYGLGPDVTDSMKEWVDWAQNNIPDQEVAMLVPNLCPATAVGTWIHYKDGVVTDLNSAVIEPSTCGSGISLEDLPVFTIQDLYDKLPGCLREYPACGDALNAYNNLDEETRIQYDTLLPFNLDSVRGYLAQRYLRAGENDPSLQILTENLPYVAAVHDMLLQPTYGILNTLSPAWVNNSRSLRGFGPYYTDPLVPKEALSVSQISQVAESVWGFDKGTGLDGCRVFTEGTTKASPLTYPQQLLSTQPNVPQSGFQQNLKVPVIVEAVTDDTGQLKICESDEDAGQVLIAHTIKYDAGNVVRSDGEPLQDDVGRSIAVLNNPKMTDISSAISEPIGGQDTSLVNSFLAKAVQKNYQDTPMLAETAKHTVSLPGGVSGGGGSADPNKDIARKDGQAEIDLCELRNFWLLPASMHKGSVSQCGDQNTLLTSTSATDASLAGAKGDVKQHLYEPSCNGQVCYDYIVSNLANGPTCREKVINPYVGIAISLNETGGLVSNLENGANIKHFGCDPYKVLGIAADPVSKFQCMVNTLINDCRAGKPDAETLSEYGYLPGNNLNSLVDLLGGSETCRDGYCFSLFVDKSTAQSAASNLRNLLPQQRELWERYYGGYLRQFQDAMRL